MADFKGSSTGITLDERSVARYEGVDRYGRRYPTHYRCERCGEHTRFPEVNHRTPARGAHSLESCIHHQENLEVLCRDCHSSETRRQHAAGELRRVKAEDSE